MVYQADVQVNFQENCEYKKSQNQSYINIPAKEITCELKILPSNSNTITQTNDVSITIGETCDIVFTAYIDNNNIRRYIKTGKVILFCSNGTDEPKAINREKDFYLNNEGQVKVRYRPEYIGDVFFSFKYIDESGFYFYNEETSGKIIKKITVKKIPTTLTLSALPSDFIINLKDEIELIADVTYKDINGQNKPVKYGTVTFLHYNKEGSNAEYINEKVIGNPVPVINGKASLKYVPIQYYDDDGNKKIKTEDTEQAWDETHAEIIKAVYNYTGSEYGVEWQYFARSTDIFKKIYILNPNDIGIKVYKDENNTYIPLEEHTYKWASANQNDKLVIVAQLFNQNQLIDFNENEDTTKDISLFIEGHSLQTNNENNDIYLSIEDYINDTFSFNKYPKKELKASYNNEMKGFCYKLTEKENQLLPGFYTITASSERQSFKKSDIIDYYDATSSSMTYFLEQNFYDLQYQIDFLQNEYEVYRDINVNDVFQAQISGLSDEEKNVLKNNDVKCYFSIPELDKKIKGKVILKNGFLNIIPNEEIIFDKTGIYDIYVNIENRRYSYQNISFSVSSMYAQAILRIKGELDMSLDITVDNQYYPGVISYTASIYNITNDTIPASISNSANNQIDNYLFTSSNTQKSKQITDLPVGQNSITFTPETYPPQTKTFTIQKATMTQKGEEIKPPIISNPNIEIPIKIETNGNKFIEIPNKNNFNIYITKNNFDYNQNIKPNSITKINDNQLLLRVPINIYQAGEWKVQIKYNGDNHYNPILSNKYDTFTTYEVEPEIDISKNNNMIFNITNMPLLEVVPVLFSITDGDNILYYLGLTDTTGKFKCDLSDIEDIEDYDTIRYEINPTNLNIKTALNHSGDFTYGDDYKVIYGMDNDTILLDTLKEQLRNYESNYLFVGIKPTTKTQKI